jgi:hypothetical protein
MKYLIAFFLTVCVLHPAALAKSKSSGGSSHSVTGYVKKDGTYVQPHQQTNPNQSQRDNWSSKPNVNPYTGKPGTKEPQK